MYIDRLYLLECDITGNSMEDIEHCIDIVSIVQDSSSGCLGDKSTDGGLHCVRVVLELTRDSAGQQ